jgi:hypothetical protein
MPRGFLRTDALPSALALIALGAIGLSLPLALLIVWVCS